MFRQYDIRGVVEEDFCPEFVLGLGKAFGTIVKRERLKKIALSGDIQLSTPKLKKHFQEGTLSVGIDVMDIGILPTPVNIACGNSISTLLCRLQIAIIHGL